MAVKEILTKRPFTRVLPDGYMEGRTVKGTEKLSFYNDTLTYKIVSQSDFIREYEPSGHKINSPEYYPDRIKYDEVNKVHIKEKVVRVAFPFQMIISVQQLIHMCGNDIHFELTDSKVSDENREMFLDFQKGWLNKNMEIAFYYFAKSVKITGDGAIAFYLKNGKVYTKNLSFLEGDILFPHYDPLTGELDVFARKYSDFDEEGEEITSWVEVWDNSYLRRFKQDKKGIKGTINNLKEYFGIEGYSLVEESRHQFNVCPIVYHRAQEGACWSFSQDSIDMYELAISHLCQNNMAYAFPIMVLKGDEVKIEGDIYGAVKAITMGKEEDAGFMSRPDSSKAFELQINILLKMIFMGSFVVMPPEIKSGDLPGVAIKLIYSPSLEKAITDAKEFDKSIDTMIKLFKFGYGIESGKSSKFAGMNIFGWIKPYVHENTAELINNLVQSVNAGFLSKESASELSGFGMNNEFDRIVLEVKKEQEADLLYQKELDKTNHVNADE